MKNININHITQATRGKWLSTAESCPYATYFHTPYWYDIIAPKQKHLALDVSFDDGASAIIPVAEIKRMGGLLTDSFSSPGGNYGGWLSTSSLGEEHVKLLTGVLMSRKNLTFRVNPFDNLSSTLIPALVSEPAPALNRPRVEFREEFTHTLDLTLGEERLYRGTSRCHKRALRRAAGGGVTVMAAGSWEEWARYYELYKSSLARWRSGGPELKTRTVYPLKFFRRIYENMAGHEILWLALKGEEPVAGLLCFYWGGHAVSWHGAASAKYFDLRPNNALYWEAILDARRRGCEKFDFNPSGGYGGVESFKDRFGAARIPAPVISTKTRPRVIIARLKKLF